MKEYKGFLVDNELDIYSKRTGRKLTPYVGSGGYMQVSYRDAKQKLIHQRLHIILANCFIPNPNNYKYINHIDSNKLNNNLNNLEWCTNSYNVKHGWQSGNRFHRNNTHVIAKDLCGNLIGKFSSIRKCAKELSIDRHKLARVLKGELRNDY